jgi:hypothetical protein
LQINQVQGVHRRVMQELCSAGKTDRKSSVFMGDFAVSHSWNLASI